MASKIALVFAGGDPPPPALFRILPPPLLTIAADSGVDHARAAGLAVDVVVGDLDSAADDGVQWASDHGAEIDVYPSSKDETDLELALDRAVEHMNAGDIREQIDELVVVGLGGGRIDHWLANLLAIAGPRTRLVNVTAYIDRSRISVVRSQRTLTGRPGELVSLLPIGGPAEGVTTTGLAYPLADEELPTGASRGVSNLFAGSPDGAEEAATATVSVAAGTLMAIQPEFLRSVER